VISSNGTVAMGVRTMGGAIARERYHQSCFRRRRRRRPPNAWNESVTPVSSQ